VIQRALASKGLVAYVLACATGIFRWPFPENDLRLHPISIRVPLIYAGFKYTYTLFLFTTPYIAYSLVLSGLYVFALRPSRKIKPMPLPAYPEPRELPQRRTQLEDDFLNESLPGYVDYVRHVSARLFLAKIGNPHGKHSA
jgi:hypothetical protein